MTRKRQLKKLDREVKITKVGGASLMIIPPKEFWDEMGLSADEYVKVTIDTDKKTMLIEGSE